MRFVQESGERPRGPLAEAFFAQCVEALRAKVGESLLEDPLIAEVIVSAKADFDPYEVALKVGIVPFPAARAILTGLGMSVRSLLIDCVESAAASAARATGPVGARITIEAELAEPGVT